MFQAVPNYALIGNAHIYFILLSGLSVLLFPLAPEEIPIFNIGNFFLIYGTVTDLRTEIEKIIQAMVSLDDLSSDLSLVVKSVRVLRQQEENQALAKSSLLPFVNGNIVFDKVDFAYPQRPNNPTLRSFSFSFLQGKKYGIIGKNGIGKSTITKTLLRLYSIQKGTISIAGNNVQDINIRDFHQRVCHLTNRPGFFQITIAENVFYPFYYRQEYLPQLINAAQKTGIEGFINSLPQGFSTELKERGGNLSEGQKQQISAMKVFIRDHDIYIFDEILSNVQVDLKAKILENIFTHLKDKTVIVIDHHYDIFKHVDSVYQFTGDKLTKIKKESIGKDLIIEQKN